MGIEKLKTHIMTIEFILTCFFTGSLALGVVAILTQLFSASDKYWAGKRLPIELNDKNRRLKRELEEEQKSHKQKTT